MNLKGDKHLRLLYLPMYSQPGSLKNCSSMHHIQTMIKGMSKNRNVFIYLGMPIGTDPEFTKNISSMENVQLIPMRYQVNQVLDLLYCPEDMFHEFNEIKGEHIIDAVITDKPHYIPYIKAAISSHSRGTCNQIPVVFMNRYFIRGHHGTVPEQIRRTQYFGLMEADLCNWITFEVMEDALRNGRKYLTPFYLKEIRERSCSHFSSLDTQRLDKYICEKPKDQIILNYAYGANTTYKYEETFDELDEIFQSGRNVKVVITTSSQKIKKIEERYKFHFEFNFGLPQDEFFAKIASAHVFIHIPSWTELSLSVLEQQYLGMVGVMPNAPWAKEATYEGYPYLVSSKSELKATVRYLVDNYWSDEVQDVIKKQREFLVERFDGILAGEKLFDKIYNVTEDRRTKVTPSTEKLYSEWFTKDEYSYEEWRQVIMASSSAKHDIDEMKNQEVWRGMSKSVYYQAMKCLGYVDTCQSNKPHWVKIKS